jgi:hypothetical protein
MVSHHRGELQSVHGSRHLDIGEHDGDVQSGFEYYDRFIGVRCFNNFKAGFFDHIGRMHSNHEFILDDEHDGSLGHRVSHSPVVPETYRNAKCPLSFPDVQKLFEPDTWSFSEGPTLKVSIFAQTLPAGQLMLSKPRGDTMGSDVDDSLRLCQGTGLSGAIAT